jgi:hypothetical protein
MDIKKIKDDYDREEGELKSFFTQLNEPVKEDPTVMRKKRY